MREIIISVVMIVIMTVIIFGAMAFVSYHTIEMEQLINRQQAVIEAQDRELTYLANVFYIQCAYTEYLKINLEDENIEAMNYKEFCNTCLFKSQELSNEEYLHDNELNITILLRNVKNYFDIKSYENLPEGEIYGE